MKSKRIPLCLVFAISFLVLGHCGYSQDSLMTPSFQFEKFKLPKGHLGNSVQTMVQDAYGFMWFASKNGLHRWDGHQFKSYFHDPTNPNSLSANYVEHIYLADDGTLWLSFGFDVKQEIIDRFDIETETFTHYDYAPEIPNDQSAFVASILEDEQGNIWVGTQYGAYQLNIKTGKFKQYLHQSDNPNSLSHNICRTIFKDSEGILWFGTGLFWDQSPKGGLNRYRPETDDFTHYFHDPQNPNSLKSNIITELFEDSRGDFWVGTTNGGLHKMNRQEGTFERLFDESIKTHKVSIPISISTTNTHVQFIFEDRQKKLWIGYFNARLVYYDPETGIAQHYEADSKNPLALPEQYVWSIFQSRDGTLWGSTTGPESAVFKIKETSFTQYQLQSDTNYVWALCESDNHNLWVGTMEQELFQLDWKTNDKRFFNPREIKISASNLERGTFNRKLIEKNQVLKMITKIVEDDSGGLWMLKSLFPGVICFNPDNRDLMIYLQDSNDDQSIGEGTITDILIDKMGQIWMVTSKGNLNLYDPVNDRFVKYRHPKDSSEQVGSGYNCKLMLTRDGQILIVGTGKKKGELSPFMGRFNPIAKKFVLTNLKLTTSLLVFLDNEIRNIEEDVKGNIWMATQKALMSVNPTSGEIQTYQAHQFEAEYLRGMVMDNQDYLWLVGEKISYFDPLEGRQNINSVAKNNIKNFPKFKQTIFKDSKGLIYIGGHGEFQYFNPKKLSGYDRKQAPETLITNFELLNDKRKIKKSFNSNILNSSAINLNYNQNTFNLRFSALAFKEPLENRIEFKLEGFDDQWRTAGIDPVATYIKVPPGEYTFKVKGATANSKWGEVNQLGILISPPIWGTWWAYILYFLLGLGLLYSFNRFQLNRKLEKAEALRLKDLDNAKNRLFTNITHEFRTPLTVISGMSEQIKENPGEWLDKGLTIIDRNSSRLNNLVGQMLDLSKLESGKLKLDPVQADIIPFVKYLCESFNSTTEASEIKLTVYAETEELVMDFDSAKLTTVIINLLSNAIKFTSPGGKIIVHFNRLGKEHKSYFSIKVKDSGSGMAEDELDNIFDRFYQVDDSSTRFGEGTGIGLALTKELVELMGGDIKVQSKLGKGSEFEVQIPITNNALMTKDVSLTYKSPLVEFNECSDGLLEESAENSEFPLALIIEDNEDVAQYLKACLKGKYHVLYASDGTAGLEMAFERVPDVVISDVMMPGKDGFEVCSTLKNDERTDHIPVILLTAKSTLQDRISGLSHGADAYLTKPFNKAELFTRLNQLMLLRKKMITRVQKDSYAQLLKKQVEGAEARFLNKTIKQIHDHISDHSFGTVQLAFRLGFSESQVYRKLKALTGKSTALFIRSVRLQRAKELILTTDLTISEISYEVGFNDPSWFSRVFKEEFGYPPSDLYK